MPEDVASIMFERRHLRRGPHVRCSLVEVQGLATLLRAHEDAAYQRISQPIVGPMADDGGSSGASA